MAEITNFPEARGVLPQHISADQAVGEWLSSPKLQATIPTHQALQQTETTEAEIIRVAILFAYLCSTLLRIAARALGLSKVH